MQGLSRNDVYKQIILEVMIMKSKGQKANFSPLPEKSILIPLIPVLHLAACQTTERGTCSFQRCTPKSEIYPLLFRFCETASGNWAVVSSKFTGDPCYRLPLAFQPPARTRGLLANANCAPSSNLSNSITGRNVWRPSLRQHCTRFRTFFRFFSEQQQLGVVPLSSEP